MKRQVRRTTPRASLLVEGISQPNREIRGQEGMGFGIILFFTQGSRSGLVQFSLSVK